MSRRGQLPSELDCAPIWLREEPEIEALLQEALNRFDRSKPDERSRDVFLAAESLLPALARSDHAADQMWKLVGELERIGVLGIRRGRPGPYDPAWKGAKIAFPLSAEGTLRIWLERERMLPALAQWRAAVGAAAHVFPGGCDSLLERRINIEGRLPEDVVAAFARMAAVSGPITLRQLSAWCFWGDSKVLDERGDLVAQLFPALAIRDRAIVVAVYLPTTCKGVLFIENQDTYTAACNGFPADARYLTLVYASGFRSSAERIRLPGGAIIHYAGPGVGSAAAGIARRFEAWWFAQGDPSWPCAFWGDLDFAGMQILKSLRDRFGDVVAWQPGYAPMLEALILDGGYLSGGNDGRQFDPAHTGCSYADNILLPAIRNRGQLDQERVSSVARIGF
jgi:hypothetical protein